MKYPHVCILYDTRSLHGFKLMNFHRFRDAAAGLCRIVAVCHRRNGSPELDASSITLNDAVVFGRLRKGIAGNRLLPGNPDLKLLAATKLLPEFEMFLRIEDDVYANDDVNENLDLLLSQLIDYDFSASYIEQKAEDKWSWWETLAIPGITPADIDALAWRAFLPIMSFNRTFLDCYNAALGDGWRGHYEVTMASVAKFHRLKCLDISKRPLRYTSYPQFSVRTIAARQPSCPPFVHPIKTTAELNAYLGHEPEGEPSGLHSGAFW